MQAVTYTTKVVQSQKQCKNRNKFTR